MDKRLLSRNSSNGNVEEQLISNATISQDGFMSMEDKEKLNDIDTTGLINLDGGRADSVYTASQEYDAGGAI